MKIKESTLNPYLNYSHKQNVKAEEPEKMLGFSLIKAREANKIFSIDPVVDAAKAVEGTFYKDIPAGISEEVIAYGLVHALSKQAEAIVGESELPLIKMTPSMLTKIEDHANAQLKALKDADWGNRDGKRKRLVRFFEALVSLTER